MIEKLQSILLIQFYPKSCRILCYVDNPKWTLNITVFSEQEFTFYPRKIKYHSRFSVFPRRAVSAVASALSLQVKDSVLAFMHDYKLKVEVTGYAIDRLVVSVKHASVNVIKYFIARSTSQSFSFLEGGGIEQITSNSEDVFRTWIATYKLNLTALLVNRWLPVRRHSGLTIRGNFKKSNVRSPKIMY